MYNTHILHCLYSYRFSLMKLLITYHSSSSQIFQRLIIFDIEKLGKWQISVSLFNPFN